MTEPFLEVTFRRGRPFAAYYYLSGKAGRKSHRSRRIEPGLVIDFARNGEPIGIEITAPGAKTWFLHALTGGEWLLELYFRVPPGTFDARVLNKQIGLKTLDEREDIQSYGDWPRVDVRPRLDGLDAVAVYVHDKAEIDTPSFRAFVQKSVATYRKALG